MARKKASKKVEKSKKEVVDEELIDLEDYEDEELDEEFLEDEEFEVEKKPKKAKKVKAEKEEEPLTLEDRVAGMEQKLNIILVLVAIMTVVAVVTMFVVIFKDGGSSKKNTTSETKTEEKDETPSYEYDVSKFKEISAADIESESKGKTILLYIGRSTCGYCVQFVPILQQVQEAHNYTTYYLDIAKIYDYQNGVVLDSKAESTMLNLKTNDAQKGVMNNFGSTPMTLVIKNGKVVDSLIGYVDAGTLEDLVTSNGLE